MSTYISRVWFDNRNRFIISDCMVKHSVALKEIVAQGGREMESNVYAHELGKVVVLTRSATVLPEEGG